MPSQYVTFQHGWGWCGMTRDAKNYCVAVDLRWDHVYGLGWVNVVLMATGALVVSVSRVYNMGMVMDTILVIMMVIDGSVGVRKY